jgi:chorismate dehydratase
MKTIGSVSYLNARPLIYGLEAVPGITIETAVPSRLLDWLLTGKADVALCPTIDFQLAREKLRILPVGGIASHSETLTVRLFSPVPLEDVFCVRVDGDSRTSVALLEVIFAQRFDRRLRLKPVITDVSTDSDDDSALLLIGDKVVTTEPRFSDYPYQLDLGAAWFEMTGLPFVFAVWMARQETVLDGLPLQLAEAREKNERRIESIALRFARTHGWPLDLATWYLSDLLHYRIGEMEKRGMQEFWSLCAIHGVIPELRPLAVHE